MGRNRFFWLLSFLGSLVFLIFYRQWLAWLLLGGVVLVPVFSLLVSLPGMLTAKLEVRLPQHLEMGTPLRLDLHCKGPVIVPGWHCKVKVTHLPTGQTHRLKVGALLPTDHAGALQCTLSRPRVCDFLGLFAFPLKCRRSYTVLIAPKPVVIAHPEDADAETVFAWKPKKGGFSENHELRLYTPGDELRQIHWKLSAKTGKLIIREPMVPDPGQVVVQLVLRGSAQDLDQHLGQCLWLSRRLLDQGIPFDLLCLSGKGLESFRVDTAHSLEQVMDAILQRPVATSGVMPALGALGTKHYIIGGTADET